MANINLKKNDLKKFDNFRNIVTKNNIFKEIIDEPDFPFIPSIYFKKGFGSETQKGEVIINAYFRIKYNLNKLYLIKNSILSIFEMNKEELDSIKVSKEKYSLSKKNLLINFEENLKDTFKMSNKKGIIENASKITGKLTSNDYKEKLIFREFIRLLKFNNYNIIKNKNNSENYPLFYVIFQNEFKSNEDKSYFIKLLKEYNNIRKLLLIDIEKYYGLMAFSYMFELNSLNKENNGINTINKNNKNYDIQIINDDPTPPPNPLVKEKNIIDKLNHWNLIYSTMISQDHIKKKYEKNIYQIYKELLESIENNIGSNANYNLYDVVIQNMGLDYNVINFIFNYVDNKLFIKAVETDYSIKDYINSKFNGIDLFYEKYIEWYNNTKGLTINPTESQKEEKYNNFDNFYTQIIQTLLPP